MVHAGPGQVTVLRARLPARARGKGMPQGDQTLVPLCPLPLATHWANRRALPPQVSFLRAAESGCRLHATRAVGPVLEAHGPAAAREAGGGDSGGSSTSIRLWSPSFSSTYGSKVWCLTESTRRPLDVFHSGMQHHKAKRQEKDEWVYPHTANMLATARLPPLRHCKDERRVTIAKNIQG